MKNIKNIIYLHPHFTLPWWAWNFALETAKQLANKGYRIFIISWKQDEDLIEKYKWKNMNFIEVKMPLSSSFYFWIGFIIWYIKVSKKIKFITNNNDWEFILFPQVFPANWWWLMYKLFNKKTKTMFMCHEPSAFIHNDKWIDSIGNPIKRFVAKYNYVLKFLDKYLVSKSDIIIANSWFSKIEIEKLYNKPVSHILYPWFDENRFKINKSLKKENYIWILSRLTKFKNIDFVIDVFADFVKNNKDFLLKIAWEWEYKENLEEKVKKMNLSKNVIFLWRLSDEELIPFYQKAKLISFPSVWEPFGMVPIEAMACGTIVVWHNSWWLKETINPEFRYDNKEWLLDLLNKVINLDTYDLSYINKFTWENTVNSFVEDILYNIDEIITNNIVK